MNIPEETNLIERNNYKLQNRGKQFIKPIKDLALLFIRYKQLLEMKQRKDLQWFFKGKQNNPQKILDVCGAYGQWGAYYQKCIHPLQYYACIDIDKELIKFGRKYFKFLSLDNSGFTVHDIRCHFPYEKQVFDEIWLFGWYTDNFKREPLFNEINRVLKKGGMFLFHMPKQGHRFCKDLDTTEEELLSLINNTGFSLVMKETFVQYPEELTPGYINPFYYYSVKTIKEK